MKKIILSAFFTTLFFPSLINAAPPQVSNFQLDKNSVPKYGKIEMTFDLDKTYANPYYYYDAQDTVSTNPTNMTWVGANGVSVDLNLTSPSGKQIKLPGFWAEDYVRTRQSGLEVLGKKDNGRWRFRFAPAEVGTYQYYVTATDKDGTSRFPASGTQAFTSTTSSNKGFIKVSPRDSRFLEYSEGQSFVPISSGRQWWKNDGNSYYYEDTFNSFATGKVNLVRLWTNADFALAIEDAKPVWNRQNWTTGVGVGVEINTPNVRSGMRASRPSSGEGWYQRLAIAEPTRDHKLTVWLKSANLSGSGESRLVVRSGGTSFNSGTLVSQTPDVVGTNDWTQYTITFKPNASFLTLNLINSKTGNLYIDDIELGPADVAGNISYNIVSDPGFERHFAKDNPNNDPNANPNLQRPQGNFINQWSAYQFDRILESAEQNGIAIQMCACSGPWFTWPVGQDQIDYSQAWVLRSWQRYYRYAIARWGYSTSILAWEKHNEHGHVPPGTALFNFYQSLGSYQKATDPYGHLRTTSQGSQTFSPGLWSSSAMDIANYHDYMMPNRYPQELANDEANFVSRFSWCLRYQGSYCTGLGVGDGSTWTPATPKPWVWGELDVGSTAWDQPNPQATNGEGRVRFLHNSLWAGLFSPLGTSGIDWYFDNEDSTTISRKLAERKVASDFFSSIDYAGENFTYLVSQGDTPPGYTNSTISSSNPVVRAYAMVSSSKAKAYVWVQHQDYTWFNSASTPGAVSTNITIPGLLNQSYQVQQINTYTGQVISSQVITASSQAVSFTVSNLNKDIAVRIESTSLPSSTATPSPVAATPPPTPTLTPQVTPVPQSPTPDPNLSLTAMISSWFSTNLIFDLNSDGKVNAFDFAIQLSRIIVPTFTPSPSPSQPPATPTAIVPSATNTPAGPTPTNPPVSSSGEWTQFGGNAQRTNYTSQTVATPWRYKWQWNGAGGDGKKQTGHLSVPELVQPITGGNRVYMATTNALYALDKNSTDKTNGTVLWSRSNIGSLSATPVYDQETIYVGTSSGFYKLNASTGATISSITTPSTLAPLLVGNVLYVTSGTNLLALNKDTLATLWQYNASSSIATPASYSTNGGGAIVFVSQDLNVHTLNSNGTLRWKNKPTPRTAGNPGSANTTIAEAIEGWPVIADQKGLVFIRYRLDWETLWTANPYPNNNTDIRSHLTSDPKRQALFVLNLSNGTQAFVPAVGNGGAGDGGYLPMGPQPVIKNVGGQEVAYVIWRNKQTCGDCATSGSCTSGGVTQWCDGREDATLGEMVLDGTTVSGYQAGDVRFVGSGKYKDQGNHQNDIQTDEMMQLTMSGNTIFHNHWLLSQANTITDRSSTLGATFLNPIKTVPAPNTIWRQVYCPPGNSQCNPQIFPGGSGTSYGPSDCPFNASTRYCSSQLYPYGDNRSYAPGFYEYHNDNNSGTQAYSIVSSGLVLIKTNDGGLIALENGNPTASADSVAQNNVLGVQFQPTPSGPISWTNAKKYIGQTVTVKGRVAEVEDHLPKGVYLGFTKDMHNSFLVRIFAKDLSKFSYDPISLKNKTISVTGPVTIYWPEGKIAEIVITDPSQIVVE